MLQIRPATLADVPAITAIYNEAILTTTATFDLEVKSEADRAAWLQSRGPRHPVLVALWEEQVVGWAALNQWSERRAYDGTAETSFYVHSDFRGRGVGRRLKDELIAAARGLQYHTLIARVAEGSEASLHLNAAAGFCPVGVLRQVGRKFGRLLDVHILQLMLNPAEEAKAAAPPDGANHPGHFSRCIAGSFRLNLQHAARLLDGISAEQMTCQPLPGMNHPQWIVGHLIHSFAAIGGELGVAIGLPAGWAIHYGKGSKPAANAREDASKAELVALFQSSAAALLDCLERTSDAQLQAPLPDEQHRQTFPTIGSAAQHILCAHLAVHLGQLSAWRRAAGLPPVANPL